MINFYVYVHALAMILSGALVIAGWRLGGLLITITMLGFALTRDNPLLSTSDAMFRINMQNMLKDLAVAGVGILIFLKKHVIKHRKDVGTGIFSHRA